MRIYIKKDLLNTSYKNLLDAKLVILESYRLPDGHTLVEDRDIIWGGSGAQEGGCRGASGGCRQRLISGLLGYKELMKERKAAPLQQQRPGPASPPPSAPKIPAAGSHGGSHPPEAPPGARSDPPLHLLHGQEVLRDLTAHQQSLKCSLFYGMKRFFKVREKTKRHM